ncbi:MAG: TetR/AcrR family transcriptional regulator [Polyangiales bacterium]
MKKGKPSRLALPDAGTHAHGPRKTPATKQISDKREAILAAALWLFAERGFHGTAVPLVAERAKVGAGTVYRYFDSKEALVNALFQRWKQELARTLMADFPLETSTRRQFHEYWRRMCRFAQSEPQAFAFLELHHHEPYLDDESRRIESTLIASARMLLERGQQELAIKPILPEVLGAIVHGALIGVFKASRLGVLELTDESLSLAEECAWEAIRR